MQITMISEVSVKVLKAYMRFLKLVKIYLLKIAEENQTFS